MQAIILVAICLIVTMRNPDDMSAIEGPDALSSQIIWVSRSENPCPYPSANCIYVDFFDAISVDDGIDRFEESFGITFAHLDALSDMPWPSVFQVDRNNVIVIKNYQRMLESNPGGFIALQNAIINSIYYFNMKNEYTSHIVLADRVGRS
jgi:hypothetical protein